jgi:hypothetical protein
VTDYVTVVSGVPRSGTSMMMRMLQAGGMELVTDGRRTADEHNPYGYFEDERVLRLARDASWVAEARGKAIKVIYRLLEHLPPGLEYRVLYMQRDYLEVFDSQQSMLLARGEPAAEQEKQSIISALGRDEGRLLRWVSEQPNFSVLGVTYARAAESAAEIARFLERDLDLAAMAAAFDPCLRRNFRRSSPT